MKILVFGAGSIGGYLGGALLAGGLDVTFLVREPVAHSFQEHGLQLTDYLGLNLQVATPIPCQTSLHQCPPDIDVVLLTVKGTGLAQAAQELAGWLSPKVLVVLFQNGVGNKALAEKALPDRQLLSGMVPFNVVRLEAGRLHRGTEGALIVEHHPALQPLLAAWNRVGVPATASHNFGSVAWGKLLLNLNNAINALAGVPLLEELNQRAYRRVLSVCMSELLAAVKAAHIQPARLARVPPFPLPWVLLLPNWLFRRVARRTLVIDPLARSSMWEDLERRRPTEIEFLNGAVVKLAESHGLTAPVNSKIIHLVQQAHQGSPGLSGEQLTQALITPLI